LLLNPIWRSTLNEISKIGVIAFKVDDMTSMWFAFYPSSFPLHVLVNMNFEWLEGCWGVDVLSYHVLFMSLFVELNLCYFCSDTSLCNFVGWFGWNIWYVLWRYIYNAQRRVIMWCCFKFHQFDQKKGV
jgi:hypothetical protein